MLIDDITVGLDGSNSYQEIIDAGRFKSANCNTLYRFYIHTPVEFSKGLSLYLQQI
jgi:hypothetical protein